MGCSKKMVELLHLKKVLFHFYIKAKSLEMKIYPAAKETQKLVTFKMIENEIPVC